MYRRDDDAMPGPSPEELIEADLRRRLACVKLAGPLMVAALIRPGLSEGDNQEAMIDALGRLLTRTIDMVDRVRQSLASDGFERVNHYRIAVEIVQVVALHWSENSTLPPNSLEAMVTHVMREGHALMRGLSNRGYEPGDDETERLSSGIAAATRIAIGMSDAPVVGHDREKLYRSMMEHLGQMVRDRAGELGGERSRPAIKSLIREFSQLYPLIWKQDIIAVRDQLRAIENIAERQAMVDRLTPYPLDRFFAKVESAAAMLLEMAESMEVFVKPSPADEMDQSLEKA